MVVWLLDGWLLAGIPQVIGAKINIETYGIGKSRGRYLLLTTSKEYRERSYPDLRECVRYVKGGVAQNPILSSRTMPPFILCLGVVECTSNVPGRTWP